MGDGGGMGKRPKRANFKTYTKEKLNMILNIALLDMQFPFLLALLGREQIAETMGGLIVTEIVGVFAAYCLKSYFETREAEKVRLEEMKFKNESEEIS